MISLPFSNKAGGLLPPRPLAATRRAVSALVQPTHPMLVQMVVTRRCQLTCGYCNEYDDHSPPVDTDLLLRQTDHLAELGTLLVTLTGGEPLLHPELDTIIRRVVSHGMVCTSITNAYALTRRWIERLNDAGLTLVQVSVDNIEPNDVSQKSWSKIKKKLLLLKEHARFKVNINAVLGSCTAEQTRRLVGEIHDMGFFMTVGLLHDDHGQIDPGLIGDQLPDFYEEMKQRCRKSVFHHAGEGWEREMLHEGESRWRCRAGARYLYVDELGKVSYCSQRRGEPGTPLLEYGPADLRRAFHEPKGCEPRCTIACVRRASSLDEWRPQNGRPSSDRASDARSSDERVRLPLV